MLALFPQILFLTPFVGTLLRLTVGATVLYIAYVHWQRRGEIGTTRLPLIGAMGAGLIGFGAALEALLGVMLIAGFATQLLAILTFMLGLKHMMYAKAYPRVVPLCRVDYFYVMVMSVGLLFMGAGALALDLPL